MFEWLTIIKAWHPLALGYVLVAALLLAPWLTAWLFRRKGQVPPPLWRRAWVSFFTLVCGSLLIPLILMFFVILIHDRIRVLSEGWSFVLGIPIVFISAGVAIHRILLKVWGARAHRLGLLLPTLVLILSILVVQSVFMNILGRAREIGKHTATGANLNIIGKAMFLYREQQGSYPDDLRRLVDAGLCSGNWLLPILDERRAEISKAATQPYNGPVGFEYIHLPDDAPPDLVWAWEPPGQGQWDGSYVLYACGRVELVPPDRLATDIAKTYQYLLSHRQPATARGPAQAGSQPGDGAGANPQGP